jgi:microcystin-dependent protein
MPVESTTSINGLDPSWPLSGDPTYQGDDHIRLLKAVLKAQFPGDDGLGLASPVVANANELNYLVGLLEPLTTTIGRIVDAGALYQSQIDTLKINLNAPAGLIMIFSGGFTPLGWVFVPDYDDYALRITSNQALGGTTGGDMSAFSHTFIHTHSTGNFTLTASHMPSHVHEFGGLSGANNPYGPISLGPQGSRYQGADNNFWYINRTSAVGGNLAHNHGPTDTNYMSFTPKYVNCFAAQKS